MDKKEFDRVWAEAFSDTFGTAFQWHKTVFEFRDALYNALYPTEEKDVPGLPSLYVEDIEIDNIPILLKNICHDINKLNRYLQAKEGK